jgi:hypothetical protein
VTVTLIATEATPEEGIGPWPSIPTVIVCPGPTGTPASRVSIKRYGVTD